MRFKMDNFVCIKYDEHRNCFGVLCSTYEGFPADCKYRSKVEYGRKKKRSTNKKVNESFIEA